MNNWDCNLLVRYVRIIRGACICRLYLSLSDAVGKLFLVNAPFCNLLSSASLYYSRLNDCKCFRERDKHLYNAPHWQDGSIFGGHL
jgi:hypothetical protein